MAGKRIFMTLCLFVLNSVTGIEREMTVNVEAGKEECFFETVPQGNSLTVEYQVIDGGAGQMSELDINFRIINHRGQPIFAEFKKPDGAHTVRAEVQLFCFHFQINLRHPSHSHGVTQVRVTLCILNGVLPSND